MCCDYTMENLSFSICMLQTSGHWLRKISINARYVVQMTNSQSEGLCVWGTMTRAVLETILCNHKSTYTITSVFTSF